MHRACGCLAALRLAMTGVWDPLKEALQDMAQTATVLARMAPPLTTIPHVSTVAVRLLMALCVRVLHLEPAILKRAQAAGTPPKACDLPSPLRLAALVAVCGRTEARQSITHCPRVR